MKTPTEPSGSMVRAAAAAVVAPGQGAPFEDGATGRPEQ
jgi:hypothetical protein